MCFSGGGSSGPVQTTVNQSNIPPELMPYATQLLGTAQQTVYNTPYAQFPGQQTAGFNPLQTQAFQNIQQMQPSASTNQAAALAGMAGTNQFTGANVNQYMSPYIQNVIQQQQQGAIRDYARQLPQMAGVATQMGGLGGSREALVQSEAQRNLQNQLGNIQATGLQNAYQNAQNQFNAANQNQLAAAGMLGNLGQQQFQQAAGVNTALLGAGSNIQQQEQTARNVGYQNFINQRLYPLQQLQEMSSLIRGVPLSGGVQSIYQAPAPLVNQVAGLSLGLGSLFGALG
jgi:hypothetical protein